MKAGDILLFHRGGFLSKIIQYGTGSIYSHVAVCVNAEMHLVIEAQGCVRANDTRKLKDYDVFRVKAEYPYDLNEVISFLVSKLNNKYDYLGVLYLGILKVFHLKRKANKWQKDRDYFCSELGYEAFMAGGLDIVPQVDDAGITSPGDIAGSEIITKIYEEVWNEIP